MSLFFLRNLINLIDGEAHWFLALAVILGSVMVFVHIFKWGYERLNIHFQEHNMQWWQATLHAIYRPITIYVWAFTLFYSLNIISDRLLFDTLHTELSRVFGVSIVIVTTWTLLRLKHNFINILLRKSHDREINIGYETIYGMSKLSTVIVVILSVLLFMEMTGMNLSTFIAFGGISGLALAFASQEIVANFFGGLMIHLNQSFYIGDRIDLPSYSLKDGLIEEIGWYQTCVRNDEKKPVYIPNSLFTKAVVVNTTRKTHRKLFEKIGINTKDLNKLPVILDSIKTYLKSHPGVDEEQPILVTIETVQNHLTDVSFSLLSLYTDLIEFTEFRNEVLVQCAQLVLSHGASLSYAVTMDVHLTKGTKE